MATFTREIGLLLSALSEALLGMSDEEYAKMLRGEGGFQFVSDLPAKANRPKPDERWPDVDKVAAGIARASTREDARKALGEIPKRARKKYLIEIAKLFGVHILTQDTIGKIEEKLVESVVGAKIRTDAIKSLPL